MSSTNKTPNVGLNQWLPTDILNWNDVNSDNTKLDAFLGNCWNNNNLKFESGTARITFMNVPEDNFLTKFSRYQIIGNICTVCFYFVFQKTPTNPVTIIIDNLPVPMNEVRPGASFVGCESLKSWPSPQVASVRPLNGRLELRGSNGQQATSTIFNTAQFQNGTILNGYVLYEIAQ